MLSKEFIYRVFKHELSNFKPLIRHQKYTFKSWKQYLHIHEMRKFDLWHLYLVKNNIPVLHSLIPEWWQNFTWNSIILFRNISVQKHQNKVILAISLLISRTSVVLKASVASMIFGTLPVGGCGGHGCYFQPNLRVISQISASHKCTDSGFLT